MRGTMPRYESSITPTYSNHFHRWILMQNIFFDYQETREWLFMAFAKNIDRAQKEEDAKAKQERLNNAPIPAQLVGWQTHCYPR